MKQHITPQQANEITEEQFYSLFDEIVPRDDWANYHHKDDWANYHHKKVTIGKLIELLGNIFIGKSIFYGTWTVKVDGYVREYQGAELIDVLWGVLKDKIN